MQLKKMFLQFKLQSLLFIGAGAGEKNTRSRPKTDRLHNTGYFYYRTRKWKNLCVIITSPSSSVSTKGFSSANLCLSSADFSTWTRGGDMDIVSAIPSTSTGDSRIQSYLLTSTEKLWKLHTKKPSLTDKKRKITLTRKKMLCLK